ncbi:homoserine dehydrogenase [Candidatus Poribacteria bacterium]|nr:homoserine dehydrogenase [Candidatus Poribacteria bacterium]
MAARAIRVGLIGLGTVGGGVVRILEQRADWLANHVGTQIDLRMVAVRDFAKERGFALRPGLLTTDTLALVRRSDIDIVVELMGGTDDARRFVLEALAHGKHVVTANKALIALHGDEVFRAAHKAGVGVYLEASVAGGIPIIKALHEGLAANEIQGIYGIVNGTCNYILTQMTQRGESFATALAAAQELGYAEAEPSFDVDGFDTAHKIAILSSLAYGFNVNVNAVSIEGIRAIEPDDIQYARELGYVIKLLAISRRVDGKVDVRVHPAMIPERHMLANVHDAFNAVVVVGDAVGPTLFYGRGAGRMPTASAVVADLVDAARTVASGAPATIPGCWHPERAVTVPIHPIGDCVTRYYLRMQVDDRPGVFAEIATILGRHDISISAVIQKEPHCEDSVPIVLMTHRAVERNLRSALDEIDRLSCVKAPTACIRVEADL